MKMTVTMAVPDVTKSVTQMAVDAALEAAQDWANDELRRLREELAPDPALADRFDRLRRLLPGANADGSQLSDADLLARAIDEIITLHTDAESAAWRDVATEPPPLRCDVLFANDARIWVGEAREVTFTDMDTGEEATEIAYYEDGDLSDGALPTAWAILPILDEPADPGLDAER